MKKNFLILAAFAALFAAAPAIADSDSNGGVGDGSTSNGGVVATTQGGFGSGF